jgi:hypothetical protein
VSVSNRIRRETILGLERERQGNARHLTAPAAGRPELRSAPPRWRSRRGHWQ